MKAFLVSSLLRRNFLPSFFSVDRQYGRSLGTIVSSNSAKISVDTLRSLPKSPQQISVSLPSYNRAAWHFLPRENQLNVHIQNRVYSESSLHQSRDLTKITAKNPWASHPSFQNLCTPYFQRPHLNSLPLTPVFSIAIRTKMVKCASYRRRTRSAPFGQSQKAHIGIKRLSAEYVLPGQILVKQRKFVAFNYDIKRRNRHVKLYPGENVGVAKNTSLISLEYGRVKFTHDVSRGCMLVNVLPEKREELLRDDLWRYRTEHIRGVEENRHLCLLRAKYVKPFEKPLVNPPTKPSPRPKFLGRYDIWENPSLPDTKNFYDGR